MQSHKQTLSQTAQILVRAASVTKVVLWQLDLTIQLFLLLPTPIIHGVAPPQVAVGNHQPLTTQRSPLGSLTTRIGCNQYSALDHANRKMQIIWATLPSSLQLPSVNQVLASNLTLTLHLHLLARLPCAGP